MAERTRGTAGTTQATGVIRLVFVVIVLVLCTHDSRADNATYYRSGEPSTLWLHDCNGGRAQFKVVAQHQQGGILYWFQEPGGLWAMAQRQPADKWDWSQQMWILQRGWYDSVAACYGRGPF